MNNSELKAAFLSRLEKQKPLDFLSDKYLAASLEEAINLTLNTKINDISIVETMPFEQIYRKILGNWRAHCLALLKANCSNAVKLTVLGVEVPTANPDYRNRIEILFAQLMSEC